MSVFGKIVSESTRRALTEVVTTELGGMLGVKWTRTEIVCYSLTNRFTNLLNYEVVFTYTRGARYLSGWES